MNTKILEIHDWGKIGVDDALERRQRLMEIRMADREADILALAEHPPGKTDAPGGNSGNRLPCFHISCMENEGARFRPENLLALNGPGPLTVYPAICPGGEALAVFLRELLETAVDIFQAYGPEPADGQEVPTWRTDAIKEDFATIFRERAGYGRVEFICSDGSRRPGWLVLPSPDSAAIEAMENKLAASRLNTVCQSALCPNLGECFGRGTATFMILGNRCTRNCRFCAVQKTPPLSPDPEEPLRVAMAARDLGLRHVVVTSVTRDDLADGGAAHFAETIRRIRETLPHATVEVLTPDFQGSVSALDLVLGEKPDVFNHNLETVARLYPEIRPQARYRRSLAVLRHAANHGMPVKSGIMLGLGETREEIERTLFDLRGSGCRIATIGQYLAPSPKHAPIDRYATPVEFERWKTRALAMGFTAVSSGPLVRSSYRAGKTVPGNTRVLEEGCVV